MSKRAKVVVIGSSNTDMAVKTPRIPGPGETVLGGDFMMTSGGKGANQAVAASRLGAEVTLVARVGTDMFGDRTVAHIGAAGVNTKYIVRDDMSASGVALICIGQDGQNSIVVAGGANNRLSPADVDAALPAIEDADVVTLQFETPLETVAHAIQIAKRLGKQVIVNPAPALDLPSDFLRGVDVITPNEVEAGMLLGLAPDERLDGADAAQRLLVLGVGAAVVTLGSSGAVSGVQGRVQRIPGKRVKAIDTTAAGDCFTGALACALGEGQELGPAVSFANAAAALSVTRLGAQTSMPARAEVESLIRQR
jgi:ribokinase